VRAVLYDEVKEFIEPADPAMLTFDAAELHAPIVRRMPHVPKQRARPLGLYVSLTRHHLYDRCLLKPEADSDARTDGSDSARPGGS
jgi:hypothetical protein